MSTIDRHNYEEYMIDFLEGNLSASLKTEVEIFLSLNPDIQEEIQGLGEMFLCREDISYSAKESLYKSETAASFEDRCINYVESQLSKEEKIAFEQEISLDKGKLSLLKDYKRAILVADESIIYKNKEGLKRNYAFKYKKLIHYSSAASIIFAISMSVLFIPSQFKNTEILSSNTELFNMPKEDIPQDIISHPEKVFTEKENNNIEEKALDKEINTNNTQPKATDLVKTKSRTVLVKISSKDINVEPIITEIDIPNILASNEIIINTKDALSNETIEEMSKEISLNSNANKWVDNESELSKADKKSSTNIFQKGGKKIKNILGKYFYTTKISHTREIIINE